MHIKDKFNITKMFFMNQIQKNFKVKNNWTSLQYNKENNEFVVIKNQE